MIDHHHVQHSMHGLSGPMVLSWALLVSILFFQSLAKAAIGLICPHGFLPPPTYITPHHQRPSPTHLPHIHTHLRSSGLLIPPKLPRTMISSTPLTRDRPPTLVDTTNFSSGVLSSAFEAIGHTPLIRLARLQKEEGLACNLSA